MPLVASVLKKKQKKGKHDRWDHNNAALTEWKAGEDKRSKKRKREEEEVEREGLNLKLDRQMTDVYKRVEALDEENWTKKQKKDHAELEFVRLGGIGLKKNKCSFTKYLERSKKQKKEDDEKAKLELKTGVYDLVEGSKLKEKRTKDILRGVEVEHKKKKEAKRQGNIHATTIGQARASEVVLDRKRVKQMEIRTQKKLREASSEGRSKNRGSMWDDKYDINKHNDVRMLRSGAFDQIGSRSASSTNRGGRKGGKKRKR
ncbi:hypothetical protein DIPPA_63490 [Diplonema papillatum]|nr:hypothetical protein DIPPA_63490 [Diplonema papillatum]